MGETWSPSELSYKVDSEGGWFDFYMWGGLTQRTGDPDIDKLLGQLSVLFRDAERCIEQLDALLPDPWEVEDVDD